MTEARKTQVVEAMRLYMKNKGGISQNKLAAECGMSGAQMSNVLNGRFDQVSDDMMARLALRFLANEWPVYRTANFNAIQRLCADMQVTSETAVIPAYSGAGKTLSLRTYADATPNAYYVQCNQLMTRKDLLRTIQRTLGIERDGRTVDMVEDIVAELASMNQPLLILDEADKLQEPCLMTIKLLYDKLEFSCGFVTAGTEVLLERVVKFSQKNKLGYRELRRRFFNNVKKLTRFDPKTKTTRDEVRVMCEDQGIEDASQIAHILETAENYGDVRTMIRSFQRLNQKAA